MRLTSPGGLDLPCCRRCGKQDYTSADCLFLDIYVPIGATEGQLPVYFYTQGGSFSAKTNPNLNGTGLVIIAVYDMAVIVLNCESHTSSRNSSV